MITARWRSFQKEKRTKKQQHVSVPYCKPKVIHPKVGIFLSSRPARLAIISVNSQIPQRWTQDGWMDELCLPLRVQMYRLPNIYMRERCGAFRALEISHSVTGCGIRKMSSNLAEFQNRSPCMYRYPRLFFSLSTL